MSYYSSPFNTYCIRMNDTPQGDGNVVEAFSGCTGLTKDKNE